MSIEKKDIRRKFRDSVFKRDKNVCLMCGSPPPLDAHHIIDRHDMPAGGYVVENGISLCMKCHELAEAWHSTGIAAPGYSPDDLMAKIGSSLDIAIEASEVLDSRS